MQEEPKSVFSELDKQGEKIDDISEKLEGISISDMYALAKRTWDYGDFQTAQKYYNHISLLRPLDWEAPLYASLCNFKGYHNMFFWIKVPEQLEPIIVATIKYIYGLNMEDKDKEIEMQRCVDILDDYISKIKTHYYKYKKDYDHANANYVFELQEWFVNVLEKIESISLNAIKGFVSFLADSCLDMIKTDQIISSNISDDRYNHLVSIASKDWGIDLDLIFKKQKELSIVSSNQFSKLSPEDKQKIQLYGKMYYVISDRIIAKRLTTRGIIFSTLTIALSVGGTISSLMSTNYFAFFFVVPFLFGILFLIKTLLEKDKISCSSLLSFNREKCRLTSNNTVVKESRFSLLYIISLISMGVSYFIGMFMSIMIFTMFEDMMLVFKILFCVFSIGVAITQCAYCFSTKPNGWSDGKYEYLYNGNFYYID